MQHEEGPLAGMLSKYLQTCCLLMQNWLILYQGLWHTKGLWCAHAYSKTRALCLGPTVTYGAKKIWSVEGFSYRGAITYKDDKKNNYFKELTWKYTTVNESQVSNFGCNINLLSRAINNALLRVHWSSNVVFKLRTNYIQIYVFAK